MGTTCDGKGEPCFCWQHFWLCGSSVPRGVPEALQQMADLLEAAEDPVPEDLGAQAGPLDLPEAAAAAVQHHNQVRNQLAEQVRDTLGSAVHPQLILTQKEEIQTDELFAEHTDRKRARGLIKI